MSDEEVVQTIKEIDSNQKIYDRIISEPLFENKISLDSISQKIFSILK